MDDEETMAAEALIGADAEAFMNSELGRTILGIAEQEAKAATEDLKRIAVSETDKIRELQNIIWRAETFKQWLLELIDQGTHAVDILRHEAETYE